MHKEIERKFLVKDGWPKPEKGHVIKQGYISTDPDQAVRVRISDNKAWITFKKQISDLSRHEFEFQISVEKANDLLEIFCEKPIIDKTRFLVNFRSHTWEIDEFYGENEGLLVAEIELKSESENFELPSWIGDEVTMDSRYLNINLIKNPYKNWKAGN